MKTKRVTAVFLTVAMIIGMFCVTASAESEITVLASENFESFSSSDYKDFTVSYNTYASGGTASAFKDSNPIYNNTFAFEQKASGDKYNQSKLTFGLKNPISLTSAKSADYLELSYDVNCDVTGSSFMCSLNGTAGELFSIWLYAHSDNYNIYVGGTMSEFCYTYGENKDIDSSWPKNVRIQLDLYNKKVVGVFLDGVSLEGNSGAGIDKIKIKNTQSANIESLTFNWGNGNTTKGSNGYTYFIDNINMVSYSSADGTSPLADKTALRKLIGKMYNISGLDDVTAAKLAAALKDAADVCLNAKATQTEVDTAYDALEKSAEPPPNEEFTIYENFENALDEGDFTVTYGDGIFESEVYDDIIYGKNTLKLKSDGSKKNVSQYVDFGFGNNAIKCSDEDPNCYAEFGIDFSSYNMSQYTKNVFIYFMDSTSNKILANFYITGGNKILLAGIPNGDITLGSIEEPSKMKNLRLVMQMTDGNGDVSQKITAVYADNVLLDANYPIEMTSASRFDKVRVMISNVKDSDFGQSREWGTNIDNMSVTKFYSASGKRSRHTVGELVSLMRSYEAEALSNNQNGVYTSEQLKYAREAINSAANVYMDDDSTDDDIDRVYKDLFAVKKRLALADGKDFDVTEISASADEVKGNDSISVNVSFVTSQNAQKTVPVCVTGVMMKTDESADILVATKVKSLAIAPNSIAEATLDFDVSNLSEAEKNKIYIKLLLLNPANCMEIVAKPTILFGKEAVLKNSDYRYSSDKCAYQIVDNDVISIFTTNEKVDKAASNDNLLFIFKKDFDLTNFTDDAFAERIVYVNSASTDESGKCAFAVKGIPSGEYVYYMNGAKGNFTSSDADVIKSVFAEVTKTPNKLDDYWKILGIDETIYESSKKNGIKSGDVLKSILSEKNYTVSEIQEFADDLVTRLTMLNAFNTVESTDYVRDVIDKYSNRIEFFSKYSDLTGRQKSYADEYILNNKDDIVSFELLESVVDAAVVYAQKKSDTGGGNGGSVSGKSYPSASVGLTDTKQEENQKEYGVITDVHTSEFTDLDDYEWAKSAIALMVKKGSANGKATGIFAPYDDVTREEFLKMLLLTFDYEIKTSECMFEDVDNASWYAPYVVTGIENGVVNGISHNMFGSGLPITREDAAVFIARVLKNLNITFTEEGEYITFVDNDYISDYAYEDVELMTKSGIIKGNDKNCFAPSDNATRAEAAKLIYEAYMFAITKEA